MAVGRLPINMIWLVLMWLYLVVPQSNSLTCYSCYNCHNFEPSSQTRECGQNENFCIKKELPAGEINRLCATQEDCTKGEVRGDSICCSGDKCNRSPVNSAPYIMAILGGVLALLINGSPSLIGHIHI